MDCPQCGYVQGPFEKECPKCARLAHSGVGGEPTAGRVPVQTGRTANGQAFKLCPACAQPAALTMRQCGRCGFDYFSSASSQAAYGAANPRFAPNYRSNRVEKAGIIGGLLCLMLLIGYAVVPHTPKHRPAQNASRSVGTGGAGMFGAAVNEQQFDARLASAAATTGGEVEVSLAWNTLSDLDLQVRDPSGEQIDAHHSHSSSGGVQDVDANPTFATPTGMALLDSGHPCGAENLEPVPEIMIDLDKKIKMPDNAPGFGNVPGMGDRAGSKFTRTPVEHIYFERAPHGTYTVYAQCYSWREPNRTPLPITVLVRSRGKTISCVNATLGPACFAIEGVAPRLVCQFRIQ